MNSSIAIDPRDPVHVSQERLHRGALVAAAGLMGFGLILLIAANWDAIGRFQRFGMIGAVIAAGALGALATTSLRIPGLLLAFAGTGGLLALMGQTYQTGADTWQLFAFWAALTLPWALAARSDTLWTPWSLIAMTAIALWYQAHGYFDLSWFSPTRPGTTPPGVLGVPFSVLYAWALSLALSAAMSPARALDSGLGARHWAFRLSLVLTLAMIGSHVLTAVVASPHARLGVYLIGLALLACIAALLALAQRRDMLLVSATALAIDVSLIVGFARWIWPASRRDDVGLYTLIGIVAAAIVAASVVAIMRLVRSESGAATAVPAAVRRPGTSLDAARPWPVVVLSGIGALLAAIPFIVATGVLLGRALTKGPATYVIAAALLPVGVVLTRKARGIFVEQLAIIVGATGALLLGWSLFRDLPMGLAGFLTGAAGIGLALWLGRPWISALLGAASTVGFALALNALLPGPSSMRGPSSYALIWSLLAMAGIAAVYATHRIRSSLHTLGGSRLDEPTLEATVSGWLAATLAGLAVGSGSAFLIAAHFGGTSGLDPATATTALLPARLLSLPLAIGASVWLAREIPSLRSPLALVMMATYGALSVAMPSLGATGLVLAASLVRANRILAVGALAAGLWIASAFYYNLSMPLAQKAVVLSVAGALLGAAAFALGARLTVGRLPLAAGEAPATSQLARGLTVVAALVVAGISVDAIRSKEALIRDGTPVFVELGPVDPRSLMQGDYMALRFRLPGGMLRQPLNGAPRPIAIGKRDRDGVLHIARIGDATTPLAEDEMRIEMRPSRGQWVVVTDAWYFKEGTGEKWAAARFGEFRVLPDGSALLVGLADKDRVPIK